MHVEHLASKEGALVFRVPQRFFDGFGTDHRVDEGVRNARLVGGHRTKAQMTLAAAFDPRAPYSGDCIELDAQLGIFQVLRLDTRSFTKRVDREARRFGQRTNQSAYESHQAPGRGFRGRLEVDELVERSGFMATPWARERSRAS